ncbi:MAG: TIGR02300 family protein [Candidatus Liberibacter ctenarytainae]|uniref:TIGR02300 family protein n=1 Tax=Candidatus Liberibacter ctenarytainae TaxID=2020335 RepID=A0A937AJV4_9HYPH|nr:TIGR02300 family protein [Candidatus Liberibacter ctenarytainae]
MAKSKLGTKRTCPDTGKRFYDLNKDPVVSPYTQSSWPLSYFEKSSLPEEIDASSNIDKEIAAKSFVKRIPIEGEETPISKEEDENELDEYVQEIDLGDDDFLEPDDDDETDSAAVDVVIPDDEENS